MDVQQLQQVSLFQEVAPSDLSALLTLMRVQTYQPGEMVFEQGTSGDCMFIIQKGQVQVYVEDEVGSKLPLIYYGQGQIFGELALLDQQPRSASVLAETDLQVMILERVDFLAFVNDRPQVGIAMMQNLAKIIRYSNNYLNQVTSWMQHLIEQGDYERIMAEASHPVINRYIGEFREIFLRMVRSLHARNLLKR